MTAKKFKSAVRPSPPNMRGPALGSVDLGPGLPPTPGKNTMSQHTKGFIWLVIGIMLLLAMPAYVVIDYLHDDQPTLQEVIEVGRGPEGEGTPHNAPEPDHPRE